jgi:hypothetical protein
MHHLSYRSLMMDVLEIYSLLLTCSIT